MNPRLTPRRYRAGIDALAAADRDLARVVERHGRPPLRARAPGFATLVLLILEQQVSLASAEATYGRLRARTGGITPGGIRALDDDGLRAAGLSRQKTRYVRALGDAIEDGVLALDALHRLDDEAARAHLVQVPGIGEWTADIYLLSALGRPDIWPAKDLALAVAAMEVKGLDGRPRADALGEMGDAWRPWRAVAARILWHYYLNTKRNRRGA